MTPQEHQLLEDFLGRLRAAGSVSKDPQANALIHARLDDQPDAAYLLVQRCLLVERALAEAQQQIEALRQQAGNSGNTGGSFLGGAPEGFGRAPSQAYAPRMDAASQDRYGGMPQAPAAAPAQAPGWRDRLFGGGAQAQPAAAQAAPAAAGGGSSFLGRAATTAAGVAGGMFLFNGIEHLIGGAGHGANAGVGNSLLGGNDAGALGGPMTENITENVTENVRFDDGRDDGGQQQGFLDGADGGDTWADNGYSDYSDDGDSLV